MRKAGRFDMSVAVVDRAGNLTLLMRGQPRIPTTLSFSPIKRRLPPSPLVFSTIDTRNRTNEPDLAGQRELVDIIPLGGGLPYRRWQRNEGVSAAWIERNATQGTGRTVHRTRR